MTLQDAVRDFESKFEEVVRSYTVKSEVDLTCSGGKVPFDAVVPALYSSVERAVIAWRSCATSQHYPFCARLEWFQEPELIEYQVTIADRRQMHRLVNPRFAVKSQFTIS